MKAKELRLKSKEELTKLLEEKYGYLRKLRFQMVRGEVKNVRELAEVKRDIARIVTILHESNRSKKA